MLSAEELELVSGADRGDATVASAIAGATAGPELEVFMVQ